MHTSRNVPTLLLACICLLTSCEVSAQERRSSVKKDVERKSHDAALIELESWLRILKGNFRTTVTSISAAADSCALWSGPFGSCTQWRDTPSRGPPGRGGPYYGFADCHGFGEGPGVTCFFKSDSTPRPGEPMVVLLGLQTDTPAIQVLSVDKMGSAYGGQGTAIKTGLMLNTKCPPGNNCARILRIDVSSDEQIIEILFSRGKLPVAELGEPFPNGRLEMRRIAATISGPSTTATEQ